jgi:hypothetical protein
VGVAVVKLTWPSAGTNEALTGPVLSTPPQDTNSKAAKQAKKEDKKPDNILCMINSF